jgi:hypothetical protein
MTRRASRRSVLAALAGGIATLAGCGYRPGGGEFRWSTGVFHGVDGLCLDDGRVLAVTREAMTFDFGSERWYDGGNVTVLDPERGELTGEYGVETPATTAARGSGFVYVGTTNGTVTAVPFEAETRDLDGEGRGTATPEPEGWTTDPGVAPAGVETVTAGESVYAGGAEGLAALSTDGSVRWRWEDGTVVGAVPGGGDVSVYALASDRLVALAGDGTVRWTHEVASERAGSEPVVPAIGPDGVYLADAAGLTALAHDGSVRWDRDVGDPAAGPALADRGVRHLSTDGTVRSFSTGGRERWAHAPGGRIRPGIAAADERAYVLADESLVAVGPGGSAWRVPLDGREEPFTPEFGPFVAGRTLVLGGSGEVRGYWRSQLR